MSISRADFLVSAATMSLALPHAKAASGVASVRIKRLAWAGFSLTAGDAQLFVDPTRDEPHDPEIAAEANQRFAIVSHHHGDHFEPATVAKALSENGFLAIEERVATWADIRTVHTQRVALHQPVMMPRGTATFCVTPVPAMDGMGAPQVSWVIDVAGLRLLHLGDTQWHGGLWDIARAYGPFDALFLPINGFQQVAGRFRNVGQPMSLSPQQAASALKLFNPTLAIPMHYGSDDPPTYLEMPQPLDTFLALARETGVRVAPLKPGESLTLNRA